MRTVRGYIHTLIAFVMVLSFAAPGFAQQADSDTTLPNDSTASATELDEIVITGASSYNIKDGVAYEPDKNAKKFSYSASSLLQRMAIPSLYADAASGEIKTLDGEPITYFIDHIPASADECKNLDPASVIRVEVLHTPTDPRFQGAKNVVNFIMKKYEYGGYAKAVAEQGFWRNTGDYSLYDKTSYKDMTYQAIGGYSYSSLHDGGLMESESSYLFPAQEIDVTTKSELPLSRARNYFASFKAHYKNSRNLHVVNTIGISGSPSPTNTITSLYTYDPQIFEDSRTSVSKRLRSTSGFWEGIIFIPLRKSVSLQLYPGLGYSRNIHDQAFTTETEDISYKINEHAWNASLSAWLYITKGNNDFSISVGGQHMNDEMKYLSQDNQNVDYSNTDLSFLFAGSHQINRISIYYNLSGKVSFEDLNKTRRTFFNPNTSLNVGYSPANGHTLRLWAGWYAYPNSISDLNTARFQTTLLDVITGNPELKPTNVYMGSLSYNWIGTSHFSLAAKMWINHRHRPVTPEYTPELSGGQPLMVRRFVNTGYFTAFAGNIGATLKLLDQSLICNANVGIENYRNKAFSLIKSSSVPINFGAQYYLGQFQFGVGMESPRWYVNPGTKGKNMWYYAVTAGYTINSFNIFLKATNFFSSSYSGFINEVIDPVYNCVETEWSSVRHRHVTLSVTYTFRYGKQINRASDINVDNGIQSGILKK